MEVQDRTPLLRPAQAAAFLCVSTRTLRRYLRSGALASYRLPSGQVRISEAALEGLLVESAKRGTRAKKLRPARRECLAAEQAPVSRQARSGQPIFFDTSPAALSSLRTAHGGAA
jgi:excisionase family DNA binding protein